MSETANQRAGPAQALRDEPTTKLWWLCDTLLLPGESITALEKHYAVKIFTVENENHENKMVGYKRNDISILSTMLATWYTSIVGMPEKRSENT